MESVPSNEMNEKLMFWGWEDCSETMMEKNEQNPNFFESSLAW